MRVRELAGPAGGDFVTQCLFENGLLTVWVEGAARAARVRLALGGALLDGKLAIAERGEAARDVQVRVSR